MGYYINQDSKGNALKPYGKTAALIADGAKSVSSSEGFQPNLVCIVLNGPFDAAAYVFDEKEFEHFNMAGDKRTKQWVVYEHAAKLSGYDKNN